MNYENAAEVQQLEIQIYRLKKQLSEARRGQPRQEVVSDYTFGGLNGKQVRLADLFGDKPDLLVIHNMGKGCPYCTLWADGFNSLLPHLQDRAAFVLVSPNDPQTQAEFAAARGWNFPMVSGEGMSFTGDMGFASAEYGTMPGVTAFRREEDGRIYRTASTFFGPGDDFCAVWPLFDLLQGGANGWEPEYEYAPIPNSAQSS